MPPPASELIIERPDLQTRLQRYGYLSLTLICWFLWLYLFVPLLSFAAWMLGATLVYRVMLQDLDVGELASLLATYGTGIGALTGLYLTWAVTSWWRFRLVDRRAPPPEASDAELAASHRLMVSELVALREARHVVLAPELLERMFGDGTPPERELPVRQVEKRASS